VIVTNADDELDDEPVEALDEELAPPLDEPPKELAPLEPLPAEEPDEEFDDPPLTVCPTVPLRVVTVPLIGAVRVVSASVFWSEVTVAWSSVTVA
jgi:hypothetical protein